MTKIPTALAPVPVTESDSTKNDSYPRPSSIRLSSDGSVIGGFGKHEVEVEAGRLVQFFCFGKNDLWAPFRIGELINFYKVKGWNSNLVLVGLIGAWFDAEGPGFDIFVYQTETFLVGALNNDGKLCVTEEFIKRCHRYGQ